MDGKTNLNLEYILRSRSRGLLIAVYLVLFGCQGFVQAQDPYGDILLNNPAIRIQATEAVNMMYNFDFEEANKRFRWIKNDYPDHPMGYFLLGLSEWWRIIPDVENHDYDDAFLAYMDTAITKAENLGDKKEENVEKVFFLAAAWAFKARLNSERENYRKASWSGKKALNYLQESRQYLDWSPEFSFGEGLYNYYREWIPENYKYLKPIMLFFPKGDKETGVQLLEKNVKESFYTKTEAQYWLMKIYDEEADYVNSLRLADYLHNTFPNNPYFHRYYTRLEFWKGNLLEVEVQSREILQRIEDRWPGYESNSGRYASFFLGYIYQFRDGNMELASYHYNRAIEFSLSNNSEDTGYYLWSQTYLARMDSQKGDVDSARRRYEIVKENSDKNSEIYQEAKKYLKETKPKGGFLFFG